MPYIKYYNREALARGAMRPKDVGELNFLLTTTCLNYLDGKQSSYQYYNDVIGALECCKLEMYRRAVAPYEDSKKEANGDVY